MPKRKSNLSKTSKKVRFNNVRISQQNIEETDARQQLNRICTANAREHENPADKYNRNANNRASTSTYRVNETTEQTTIRKSNDQVSTRMSRASESYSDTVTRNVNNRDCTRMSRASESDSETATRNVNNRDCTRMSRASESDSETATRNVNNRDCTRMSRASESDSEIAIRRENDAMHRALLRSIETDEDRSERLNAWRSDIIIWRNAAFNYDPLAKYAEDTQITVGDMNVICVYCNAKKYKNEAPGLCCSNGKVELPLIEDAPEPLKSLLYSNSLQSKIFLNNIRNYNSAFQMTSFGAHKILPIQGYNTNFKIQGQVYHLLGPLNVQENETPKYLQMYFMGDTEDETKRRIDHLSSGKLDTSIVLNLQHMLHNHNNLIQTFKFAQQQVKENYKVVINAEKRPTGEHERRFNEPTHDDVAVLVVGEQCCNRDIILQHKEEGMQRINELHRSYDALQYPLIFWKGQDGYNILLKHRDNITKLTSREMYCYYIMIRINSINYIHQFRELLNQFIVDMYVKIETERLLYIRLNQRKLRVENYDHLKDAIQNDGNLEEMGKLIILPSSFTGSPRYMQQRTQDAMVYVRKFGTPDLFITFTCNPKWIEITKELENNQKTTHRHDIIARIFQQKLVKLMHLFNKAQVFGEVRCFMYTVEWQKRGLPHAHILIWLVNKIHASKIDEFISAEIPNESLDKELYDVVTTQMIHGPCGIINNNSPCMKDSRCTKRFPKDFSRFTQAGEDGYPKCRRRRLEDGGEEFTIKRNNMQVIIDNRWVVPYCPLLSKIFKAHINVEFCNSVKSIKYICKYINKGSDMSMVALEGENGGKDEISDYQLGRYVGSNEAFWRLMQFPIHKRFPAIIHLAVHLENGQRVYFNSNTILNRINNPNETTLTAFFKLCREDEFASTLLYEEVASYYTWNSHTWKKRKQGTRVDGYGDIRKGKEFGRVYTVHFSNAECFYMRLLLFHIKGPTSFDYLRTVNEIICGTFREACIIHGLLENDNQWDNTINDAVLLKSPIKLRNLFAIMITMCNVSNPLRIWNKYKEDFTEDYLFKAKHINPSAIYSDTLFNLALIYIEDKLQELGGRQLVHYGLPATIRDDMSPLSNDVIRETSYNMEELNMFINENENRLTDEQKEIYLLILKSINEKKENIYFLNAAGGTGKTYLINLLLSKVRSMKNIAIAVASSGIASTLLQSGRTVHSTFKLPLDLSDTENTTCNISRNSGAAHLLRKCSFIVWDECTMSHKGGIQAVDRLLKDIRNNDLLMGGITVLFSGDFRQILPIIPNGTKIDELNACLKYSYLWNKIIKLSLTRNMRLSLNEDSDASEFANNLIMLGDGNINVNSIDNSIKLPVGKMVSNSIELKNNVYPDFQVNYENKEWLSERCILAPINDVVYKINEQLLNEIPEEIKNYKSIDNLANQEDNINYSTEFLNSLQPSGFPPHNLKLKRGASIILLRNIEPPRLCNGTRLVIQNMYTNVIEAIIITGTFKGQEVFIPKIPMTTSNYQFEFRRLQFPVRLSFSMTINKSQGQTLKVVGLDLSTSCFSHGQLYVGCSRVTNGDNLYILSEEGRTQNVVYKEALRK